MSKIVDTAAEPAFAVKPTPKRTRPHFDSSGSVVLELRCRTLLAIFGEFVSHQ